MSKEWEKFINKQDRKRREQLLFLVDELKDWNMRNYDCKPIEGEVDQWRVRHRNTRLIIEKDKQWQYNIIDIDFRWDIYK